MTLRYLPGEEEDMIEVLDEKQVGVVEEKADIGIAIDLGGEEGPEEGGNDNLLDIDMKLIYDIAEAAAQIVINHIDDKSELSDERVRFFYEEVAERVEDALSFCDFTKEAFELWQEMEWEKTSPHGF